jgi:hypothetical protein
MSSDKFLHERDFSLVLGGPVFQFLRRSHLTGDTLQGRKRSRRLSPSSAQPSRDCIEAAAPLDVRCTPEAAEERTSAKVRDGP